MIGAGKGPLPGAEGPDRRAPFPPTPPNTERPGGSRGEPLTWQPPTQGETFIILKADVTKAHRRIKVLQKDWKYQVACIQNRWWVNRVGTYGMASAQLPSGGLALSLCGRLLLGPQMQQGGLGRHSHPGHSSGAGSPAFLEEDGALPGQYLVGIRGGPNHALCAAGSSQARHNPGHSQTAGPGGHLHQQGGGTSPGPDSMGYFGVSIDETFPPALLELEEGSSTRGSHWHLHLLPHFHGRGHLMRELANRRTMHGSDVPSPDKSRVKWFQHRITPEGEPWAFTTGDPQRAIAALELFGLLLLVRAVLLCAAGSASHTRILVASDNQGNVFSLLNDSTRRMPNAAILMEIVLTLHDHQVMLGPSHVKRDFNTWADELTHPDPQFPTENRVFPSVESELIKLIFATFLPHP